MTLYKLVETLGVEPYFALYRVRMSHWRSTEPPVATRILTEEEKKIALSQITALERFAAARDGLRAIVCVPPREGENERWIAVNPISHQIDFNIRQPDQNRTVLYASES